MTRAAWRTLHTSVLAAWLGGAALTAFRVAPAAFAHVPSRAEAGRLVGQVLGVVYAAGLLAGLTAVAASWVRTGPWRRLRVALGTGVVLLALAGLILRILIARIRDSGGADGRTFGILHGVSVSLFLVSMLAAFAAVAIEGKADTRGI